MTKKEWGNHKMITKIVLTGGPCAGKSTGIKKVEEAFTKLGYTVLLVPETASELICGGVSPTSCKTTEDFQKYLAHLQMEKEKIFEQAARSMEKDKVLIVCDRGLLDSKAYMTQSEFDSVLAELSLGEVEARDSYDAVFHLVTAAKGAEDFYTKANNAARKESPEQAAALDDKLIGAWTGHPHLRVIDNSTDFDEKCRRLNAEIAAFLGEPEPMEIERKYLIEYPDIEWLESLENCSRVEIIQTYLNASEGDELRVRQRGCNGNYVYYQTAKRKINATTRIETEKRLTKEQYLSLLMNADITRRQIRKDRYCLTYDTQYFEIDVYPFWKDRAIMEIELRTEDQEIRFPEQIKIIREVTEDEAYKNASLSKKLPENL